MNRITRALITVAACFFAQQASAADLPAGPPLLRAPSAVIAANWQGFYVGGHAAYAWADGSYSVNDASSSRFDIDTDGFMGGGQAGVQAQWGHWVAGVEGTYSWADLTQSRTTTLIATRTSNFDLRYIGTITGKLGWSADRWLIYGKGGVAYGRVHTLNENTTAALSYEGRNWETGYTLGIGLEYMMLPNWSLGLEFDYYSFTFNRTLVTSAGGNATISDSNADIYAIMLRANYLFNRYW